MEQKGLDVWENPKIPHLLHVKPASFVLAPSDWTRKLLFTRKPTSGLPGTILLWWRHLLFIDVPVWMITIYGQPHYNSGHNLSAGRHESSCYLWTRVSSYSCCLLSSVSLPTPFDPVSQIPPNLPLLLSLTALVQALVTSCLEHCKILPAAKAHSFIHKAHCLWCWLLKHVTDLAGSFYSPREKWSFSVRLTVAHKTRWKGFHWKERTCLGL